MPESRPIALALPSARDAMETKYHGDMGLSRLHQCLDGYVTSDADVCHHVRIAHGRAHWCICALSVFPTMRGTPICSDCLVARPQSIGCCFTRAVADHQAVETEGRPRASHRPGDYTTSSKRPPTLLSHTWPNLGSVADNIKPSAIASCSIETA